MKRPKKTPRRPSERGDTIRTAPLTPPPPAEEKAKARPSFAERLGRLLAEDAGQSLKMLANRAAPPPRSASDGIRLADLRIATRDDEEEATLSDVLNDDTASTQALDPALLAQAQAEARESRQNRKPAMDELDTDDLERQQRPKR